MLSLPPSYEREKYDTVPEQVAKSNITSMYHSNHSSHVYKHDNGDHDGVNKQNQKTTSDNDPYQSEE